MTVKNYKTQVEKFRLAYTCTQTHVNTISD